MIRLSSPDLGSEEYDAVVRVLKSGQLVHGEECELFEQELAKYLNCKEVIVASSGTAALHLALVSLGIGPGDAVLVPDFTFPATVNAVELVGARPIFVDVDLKTFNLTAENVRKEIEAWNGPERIRAIMPVHEFGCPVDMTKILKIASEYELKVIEDAACALGAVHNEKKIGTFGHAGCFSFHPRKAITTGEGGAIAVNDEQLAREIRTWRNHGIQKNGNENDFVVPGFNYRLTNFQAALGRTQLKKFDDWLKVRKNFEKIYREFLSNIEDISLPSEVEGHAWQTFMVVLEERTKRTNLIESLKEQSIETNLGAYAIHCLSYYRTKYPEMCQRHKGNCAEVLFRNGLALPFSQTLKKSEIVNVCNSLVQLLERG